MTAATASSAKMSKESAAILNIKHPACIAAGSFLQGYAPMDDDTLHLITLLRCAYINEGFAKLPKQLGMPSLAEIESVLNFLDRAQPADAIRFLTYIGEHQIVKAENLTDLDITYAARLVMDVLLNNIALGASLKPT